MLTTPVIQSLADRRRPQTSFDGAMDEPDIHTIQNKPTKSSLSSPMVLAQAEAAINLNRALPLLPEENTSSLAVRSDANSLNNSDTGHSPVSFTPRSSANNSVASSRQDFRNITRDLLLMVSTPEPQHAAVNALEPEKYNPANSDNNSETMGRMYVLLTLFSKTFVIVRSLRAYVQ